MSDRLDELFEPYPTHLSVANLAAILGVTQKTAYEYLSSGELPVYRIGSKWLILRDEIRDYIRQSAVSEPIVRSEKDRTERS